MALKTELEELLKVMKPEDAEKARGVLEAYPQLADGWLRQADYSRQVAEARTARDKAEKLLADNKEWWNVKKPLFDSWEAEKRALTEENIKLRTAVESASKVAAAAAGSDGAPADLAAIEKAVLDRMRATGGMFTRDDIQKLAGEEAQKRVEDAVAGKVTEGITNATNDFLTKTFPQTTNFILDAVDLTFQHQAEFGKPLDRKALSEYMRTNQLADPKKAYEQMVAPERQQRLIRAEAEKLANQIVTERTGIPGSSAPGSVGPGPFQIRLSDDAKVDPLAGKDVRKIGSGDLGRAAAAEMVAEGKF